MQRIAVLLTCFNRKQKTLSALHKLYQAHSKVADDLALKIFLTDDASNDGTADAVAENYPDVIILKGNGSLFWAGGMRKSWRAARKENFDGFLLLNDDTDIFPELFETLLQTHQDCLKRKGEPGVYIGSTYDAETKKLSYGGAKLTNRFWFKYHFIEPMNEPQDCDLGNANIMLVANDVVDKIGILTDGYVHGVADYDYTLKAKKKGIPVLIAPGYCGTCTDDHRNIYNDFHNKSFSERLTILKNPIGLDYKSNLLLQKKHFPLRVPFFVFSAMFKLIFPSLYKFRFSAAE